MHRSKEYYEDLIKRIDVKLEQHLEDILNDSLHKSPKAEQYVTALVNARFYAEQRLKPFYFKELQALNKEMIEQEIQQEVENENKTID